MKEIPDTIIIESLTHEQNLIKTQFQLNPDSDVFKGHFPGQPVLPGVIQMQLVRKVLENELNCMLQLLHAPAVKFLSPIVPHVYPYFQLKITYNQTENELQVDAEISSENSVFMKLKSRYVSK